MSCERHSVQSHQLAKQIVDGNKYIEGLPRKLGWPKLVQPLTQYLNQLRYRRIISTLF